MKIAIIPPHPLLETYASLGDCHLVLASHVLENPAVAAYYVDQLDKYVILDNSAHEKKFGESWEVLLEAARLINPDEIVLPDVLFDAEQTAARTCEAHDHLRALNKPLMAVPQGVTPTQWWNCLHLIVNNAQPIQTIGISKDFEVWDGGLPFLLQGLLEAWRGEVHLLGWGRDLKQLRQCALISREYGDRVRSVDSAKPLAFAHQAIRLGLNLNETPPYPGRPPGYFQLEKLNHPSLALHNIEAFRRTANP